MSNQKRLVEVGDYFYALSRFREIGGMFFPQTREDGHSTIVSGDLTLTIFPPNSKRRSECQMLAHQFNYPQEIDLVTPSRLAKWYIKERLRLPYEATYFSKKYLELARDGYHWHYLYAQPGRHGFCFEVDLKSAYATAWLDRPSLLYDERMKWIPDNGAIKRLKADMPHLPKWFRLCLLGVISGHQLSYYIKDKKQKEFTLKQCSQSKVSYGAAFNAAHIAIWKVYNTMRQVHEIGGNYIKRIHTDGFIVSDGAVEDPRLENELCSFLEKKGFIWSIKASGTTFIKDVGNGYCGKKIFGNHKQVLKADFLEGNPKPDLSPMASDSLGQFGRKAAKIAGYSVKDVG